MYPGKYYNSLVKPSIHRNNKSVSALKQPMIYSKSVDPEVVNALYLRPKLVNFPIKDELAANTAAYNTQNINQSKVMSAAKSK